MAVERKSHSTSTRVARDKHDEEMGSQRRGSRRIALAWTSRTHDCAGDIDGSGIGGISDGIDISGVSDGHEEIGTRRARRRSRACLPVH